MKRGYSIKEEIQVYFRMVFGEGVAGKKRPCMGGKRKMLGTMGSFRASKRQYAAIREVALDHDSA